MKKETRTSSNGPLQTPSFSTFTLPTAMLHAAEHELTTPRLPMSATTPHAFLFNDTIDGLNASGAFSMTGRFPEVASGILSLGWDRWVVVN